MTPLEISDYKRDWAPGIEVTIHSDWDDRCRAWCKENLKQWQWNRRKYTNVYEHTYSFEDVDLAKHFYAYYAEVSKK